MTWSTKNGSEIMLSRARCRQHRECQVPSLGSSVCVEGSHVYKSQSARAMQEKLRRPAPCASETNTVCAAVNARVHSLRKINTNILYNAHGTWCSQNNRLLGWNKHNDGLHNATEAM